MGGRKVAKKQLRLSHLSSVLVWLALGASAAKCSPEMTNFRCLPQREVTVIDLIFGCWLTCLASISPGCRIALMQCRLHTLATSHVASGDYFKTTMTTRRRGQLLREQRTMLRPNPVLK